MHLCALSARTATAAIAIINFMAGCVLRSTGHLIPVLIECTILGAALPWSLIAVVTAAQRLTPAPLQGRVSAAITLLMFAPQPLAQALGAGLIAPVGYRAMQLGVVAALAAMLLGGGVRRARHAGAESPEAIKQ